MSRGRVKRPLRKGPRKLDDVARSADGERDDVGDGGVHGRLWERGWGGPCGPRGLEVEEVVGEISGAAGPAAGEGGADLIRGEGEAGGDADLGRAIGEGVFHAVAISDGAGDDFHPAFQLHGFSGVRSLFWDAELWGRVGDKKGFDVLTLESGRGGIGDDP